EYVLPWSGNASARGRDPPPWERSWRHPRTDAIARGGRSAHRTPGHRSTSGESSGAPHRGPPERQRARAVWRRGAPSRAAGQTEPGAGAALRSRGGTGTTRIRLCHYPWYPRRTYTSSIPTRREPTASAPPYLLLAPAL